MTVGYCSTPPESLLCRCCSWCSSVCAEQATCPLRSRVVARAPGRAPSPPPIRGRGRIQFGPAVTFRRGDVYIFCMSGHGGLLDKLRDRRVQRCCTQLRLRLSRTASTPRSRQHAVLMSEQRRTQHQVLRLKLRRSFFIFFFYASLAVVL